jgi:hypothetical protein
MAPPALIKTEGLSSGHLPLWDCTKFPVEPICDMEREKKVFSHHNILFLLQN